MLETNSKLDINKEARKRLVIVCCVCSTFMIIEFLGGLWSNSLAIMTDAAHLLSDLAGFIISILAISITSLKINKDYTFGYYRAEIVGALVSVFIVLMLTIILLIEGLIRLVDKHHNVDGSVMLFTSIIGLIFNLIMAYVLHSNV
jgi:zinc transporter 2